MDEHQTIISLLNHFGQTWRDTVNELSGLGIETGMPQIRHLTRQEAVAAVSGRGVIVSTQIKAPAPGVSILFIPLPLGAFIPERVIHLGATEPPGQFSDLHRSAMVEVTEQVWRNSAEGLSALLGRGFKAGASDASINTLAAHLKSMPALTGISGFLAAEYQVNAAAGAGALIQLFPADFIQALFQKQGQQPEKATKIVSRPQSQKKLQSLDIPNVAPQKEGTITVQRLVKKKQRKQEKTESTVATMVRNLETLLDIPVTVTVELGRAKLQVERLLNLGPGSIIELDAFHKKPIRVLVNEKLIAVGDVVSVDDKFGVRIVEVVAPEKRLEEF